MAIKRIDFLKVPLDIVTPENMEGAILDLLSRDGPQHIVFVSLWDLLRARHRGEFRSMILKAALVIPTSKSIISGVKFLKKEIPIRYQPFTMIIDILGILEKYYKSLYLFGAHQRSLIQAERNVRSTFPKLSVVGRFAGYYHKTMERNILTAIAKAHPSLVIVSAGIPSNQKWIHRNRSKLHNGLFIWNSDVIDIFADRKRRISEKTFDRGMEYFPQILKNPLRIFRIFQYLWYNVIVLLYRIFQSSN